LILIERGELYSRIYLVSRPLGGDGAYPIVGVRIGSRGRSIRYFYIGFAFDQEVCYFDRFAAAKPFGGNSLLFSMYINVPTLVMALENRLHEHLATDNALPFMPHIAGGQWFGDGRFIRLSRGNRCPAYPHMYSALLRGVYRGGEVFFSQTAVFIPFMYGARGLRLQRCSFMAMAQIEKDSLRAVFE
jgi:hypothetical protein